MKKELAKRKRRMLIKIFSVMLVLSLAVTASYAYFTCKAEKNTLLSNAQSNFYGLVSEQATSLADNSGVFISNNRAPYSEILITDNNGTALAHTENTYNLNLPWGDRRYGFVDFSRFKGSLTEEQYKEICALLTQTESGNPKYSFVVTEYCYAESSQEILVSRGKIIPSKMRYGNYVEIETIAEYSFAVADIPHTPLNKSDYLSDSVLDSNFILGKYQNMRLLETIQNVPGENRTSHGAENHSGYIQRGFFTYIYYNYDYIYSESIGGVNIAYAEEINIFDNCKGKILLMALYSLLMFTIAGISIGIISWQTVKKQLSLEQERRDWTNALAHDIKTPLFIISGNAETLLELTEDSGEKEIAQNIIDCSTSANRLVEDMLGLSSLEADNYTLNIEKINLNELISDLIKPYSTDIDFKCTDSVIINADNRLCERLFLNLIDNAVKHTDDKNSVKITLDKKRFTVSNHCIGLNEKDLNKIFEPYKSFSNKGGNGLGLSVVKTICGLHNFKYSVSLKNSVITFILDF